MVFREALRAAGIVTAGALPESRSSRTGAASPFLDRPASVATEAFGGGEGRFP